MKRNGTAFLLTAVFCVGISAQSAPPVDLANATTADLNIAFNDGRLTAGKLTAMYLARIDVYDKQGPAINAVISLNPNALRKARALDAARSSGTDSRAWASPKPSLPRQVRGRIRTSHA
jgi:amidase